MEGYIEKDLNNSWPYWHIVTLKKLDEKNIKFVYDVDNDEFLSLEDAEKRVNDDNRLRLIPDHKLFGLKTTIKNIFEDLKKGIFPVIPDETKKRIEENMNKKVFTVLKTQSDNIRANIAKQEDYISDINRIATGLKGILPDQCFNLSTGNIVSRRGGSIVFNKNDEIPLCLPNTFENAEEIFKTIEKRVEKVMKVKTKTEILSDEDIEKMNIKRGIPPDFKPDVKRTPSFPIPADIDIKETMRKYKSYLGNV